MRMVNRLRELSWADGTLLLQAVALLGLTRVALRFVPFRTLIKVIAWTSRSGACASDEQVRMGRRIAWAVDRVARYIPGAKCLAKAIAVHLLLSGRRVSSELRIGAAKGENGIFEAHAWVKVGDQVVVGWIENMGRFRPLLSVGNSSRTPGVGGEIGKIFEQKAGALDGGKVP